MRVIIIGGGDVGQHLSETLSAEAHSVTLVDANRGRCDLLQDSLDALVLPANGASPKALAELGVDRADLLIAVTQSDEVNVIAALAAHQLGAKTTIARVRDTEYFGTDESFARDKLGIDFVINSEEATAEDLVAAIQLPGAVRVEYFADDSLALAEVILSERSPLVGRPLGEREMIHPHYIIAVHRERAVQLARPEERLQVGDHIVIAASREYVGEVVAHLAGKAKTVKDVIIFGGGRLGFALARRLEALDKFSVTILESELERAQMLAEQLHHTLIVHTEGASREDLLTHNVDSTDAFVACTRDDRTNLLASLHAKQLGADLCLPVVSREEFVPLVAALGIDAAYSPRLTTAEGILRFVRGENVRALHLLLSGSEVLELCADAGSKAIGKRLSQLKLPRGSTIAAIVRDGEVIIPHNDEVLTADDRVLLFGDRGETIRAQELFRA